MGGKEDHHAVLRACAAAEDAAQDPVNLGLGALPVDQGDNVLLREAESFQCLRHAGGVIDRVVQPGHLGVLELIEPNDHRPGVRVERGPCSRHRLHGHIALGGRLRPGRLTRGCGLCSKRSRQHQANKERRKESRSPVDEIRQYTIGPPGHRTLQVPETYPLDKERDETVKPYTE